MRDMTKLKYLCRIYERIKLAYITADGFRDCWALLGINEHCKQNVVVIFPRMYNYIILNVTDKVEREN